MDRLGPPLPGAAGDSAFVWGDYTKDGRQGRIKNGPGPIKKL